MNKTTGMDNVLPVVAAKIIGHHLGVARLEPKRHTLDQIEIWMGKRMVAATKRLMARRAAPKALPGEPPLLDKLALGPRGERVHIAILTRDGQVEELDIQGFLVFGPGPGVMH